MIIQLKPKIIIRATGDKEEFLRDLKTVVREKGHKGRSLVRCLPGPEDQEGWKEKVREAADEYNVDPNQLIVALPPNQTEEFLSNGMQRVQAYDPKKLSKVGKHIYQPNPNSLITSLSKDPLTYLMED